MNDPCPRCGHDISTHYPNHQRPTTACVTCLDGQVITADPWRTDAAQGICCTPPDMFARPS